MSRVTFEKTIILSNKKNLNEKLQDFFYTQKMKIIEQTDELITLSQGSQIYTRLIGGWFVSPSKLPKKVMLKIINEENLSSIQVKIEETLGIGYLDLKLKNKYLAYFELWMLLLQEAIK